MSRERGGGHMSTALSRGERRGDVGGQTSSVDGSTLDYNHAAQLALGERVNNRDAP